MIQKRSDTSLWLPSSFVLMLFLWLTSGCANYKLYQAAPSESAPAATPVYTVYALGDLSHSRERPQGILPELVPALTESGENSALLILGDFVSKEGLPPRDDAEQRAEAETELNAKLDLLRDYAGRLLFVPGEREYGPTSQTKHLKRLTKYVEKYLDREDLFLPEDECGGPDDVELTDDISVVGINTAWYLNDWNKDLEVNNGCEIKDRESFLLAVTDEVNGLRDKTVLLAMHHPLEANGNHGGYYSAKEHIFPLRDLNKNLWVPLPGVGTIYRLLQAGVGSTQDAAHPLYKQLVSGIEAGLDDSRNLLVVAAHEHLLQYTPHRNYTALVSGAGSEGGPGARGNNADFVYGRPGYMRTDFYEDGSVWVSFLALDEKTDRLEVVYRKRAIEDRFAPMPDTQKPIPTQYTGDDVVKAPIYSEGKANRSGIYRALLGDHYREIYYTPIKAPVAYLDTLRGGLSPYERGGGMQTMSLRLRDKDDRIWDMRSIRKNPNQLLPYPIDISFAADILRDQFTAAHPFGAYAVPRLSQQLGLYYMKPSYAYVPKQSGLKQFNDTYGNEIYMIQERPDDNWETLPNYGNAKKIIGTDDVLEAIHDDWKKQIDQRTYLKARMLDMVIGDWDRHIGQWRWVPEKDAEGLTLYEPIAKDRDQVFSDFDGLVMDVARLLTPPARKLKPFTAHLTDPKWSNFNARWNDRLFLNRLTREDWQQIAQEVVAGLTDELFQQSIADLPDTVAQLSVEKYNIVNKLIGRRGELQRYTQEYYEVLAKHVNITGTNKDDYFRVERRADGSLRVQVYDADSEGDADEKYYDRIFYPKETKEVVLYGLDGDDHFEMEGDGASQISVRIVGGQDGDVYDADSGHGVTRLYDAPEGMEVKDRTGGERFRFSPVRDQNVYNFQNFRAGYGQPYPLFGFDPTDGFSIGAGVVFVKHAFKKDPYAQRHKLDAAYAFRSHSVVLIYAGEFTSTFGFNRDLLFDIRYRSPDYIYNFFGVGNETISEFDEENMSFNWVPIEQARFAPQVRLRFRNNSAFVFGPAIEYGQVSRKLDGVLGISGIIDERAFEAQKFVGAEARYEINSLAVPAIPDRGLIFHLQAAYKRNVSADDRQFVKVETALSYYLLFLRERLQLATRIGFAHLDGEYEFYQLPNLGGRTNLRGFTTERFYGNTLFYQNIDIRLRGFGFSKGSVPTTGGLLAGFDYGRVWQEGEDSDKWHSSVGGGIWLAPLNAAIISATYFVSEEDSRITVGLGFPF